VGEYYPKEKNIKSATQSPKTTDEYIAQFPQDIQLILQQIRAVIKETAPEAVERISYGMPGFYQTGMLVWFAGYKNHIGFYPTGEGIEAFKAELSPYKFSKGAVQFPIDQPMPYDLIRKIVKHRVEQTSHKSG
jgi:uncharacterized protein YdhG (YjbR/CyaY superfamily)